MGYVILVKEATQFSNEFFHFFNLWVCVCVSERERGSDGGRANLKDEGLHGWQ